MKSLSLQPSKTWWTHTNGTGLQQHYKNCLTQLLQKSIMQTLKQHLHDTLYGSSVYPVHTVQLTYWEKCKISYDIRCVNIRAHPMLMGKVTAADALFAHFYASKS